MLLLQTNKYIYIYIPDKPSNTDFERQRWLPLKYKTEYCHVFRRFLFFLVYQFTSNHLIGVQAREQKYECVFFVLPQNCQVMKLL